MNGGRTEPGPAKKRKRRKKRRAEGDREGERPRQGVAVPAARPQLGFVLFVVALLLGLVTVGTTIWDVAVPGAGGPGSGFGGIVGLVIRTMGGAALTVFVFNKSRAYSKPEEFSEGVVARSRLREIEQATRGHEVGGEAAEGVAGVYAALTDDQLASVWETIERERAPARYDELAREVRRRVRA